MVDAKPAGPGSGPRARGPVLITDFDGTLYRGDDPIRYYAEHAAQALPAADRKGLLGSVDRYLELGSGAADRAGHPAEAAALRQAVDGWESVARLAELRYPVAPAALGEAFLATRAYMTTPACALEVPEDYRRLLAELRAGGVRVVLATNSPEHGLGDLLDRLGVRPLLDAVVSGTGKPAGLHRLLRVESGVDGDSAGEPGGLLPGAAARVFAIGDHWVNDISPAVELGVPSGYIDRFGRADGPATAVAPDVEGLLPAVRAWRTAASESGLQGS